MEISIEQLKSLLDQQKGLCREKFRSEWDKSEFLREINDLDKTGNLQYKIHDVRDRILGADYPEDFKVLQKYIK